MSYKDLTASAIGTSIAEFITLPICTIKTNYQTNLQYKSIVDVAKEIYSMRGLYGFYSASFAAVGLQIISTSTKYSFYNYFRDYRVTAKNDMKNNIINGVLGGIVSSVAVHWVDVIKIHKQNGLKFLDELKSTGPKIFYRGYSKSLSKSVVLTASLFPLNDYYKSKTNNTLLAAGLSSFTVTSIVHPFDYLKVRHISDQTLYPKFSNIPDFFKYYYRGVHVNLMRVMPHFMITMLITEKIKKQFESN